VIINNVQIIGTDASSFSVQNNNCQNQGTFRPNNTCQVYIQFQPTSTGIQYAQLEINNDGTTNPLFVSLTGEGLNGPIVTVSPTQAIYGNVTLGSQSSQTFTLTDTGDAPLQIQAMLVIAGSPEVFPISNNSCSGRQISAGSSCHVTVGFVPIAAGDKDASLFLITNASNPGVTTIGLNGTGVAPTPAPTPAPTGTGTSPNPAPAGTATVTGSAQAGKLLTCSTASYSPRTSFSYQWLRTGKPITGATGRTLPLGDADVGARLSCRVKASAPGGTQTITSPPTAPTLAQLTVDKVSVHGFTINAKLTVSSGKLAATGHITNPHVLTSRATGAGCKAGQVLVKLHGTKRCVLTSFGARSLTITAGGAHTVSLSPNPAAQRALNTGQTLHVKETITLTTAGGLKPMRATFNITVHGNNTHKQQQR
jgi:VCBS repeat-containing protein